MSNSAASFSFEPHIKLMMTDALNICSTSIYLSQASMVEDQVIPDAGHVVNLDQPKLFNEALRTFLRRR